MNNDILMLIQMLQNGDIAVNASADSIDYLTWINSFADSKGIRIFPVRAITLRYYLREYISSHWEYTLIKTLTYNEDDLVNIATRDGAPVHFNYLSENYHWRGNDIYIGNAIREETPNGYHVYGHPDYQEFEFLDLNGNSMSVTCSLTGTYNQDDWYIWATPGGEVSDLPADAKATGRMILSYYLELVEAD